MRLKEFSEMRLPEQALVWEVNSALSQGGRELFGLRSGDFIACVLIFNVSLSNNSKFFI